jgi:hypothetical protein
MSQPKSIQIGGGITIGGGIGIGAAAGGGGPSLTLTSADFTYAGGAGGTIEYITNGGGDLICPLYFLNNPTGSIGTAVTNFFSECGYDINTSYVFRATFASATPLGGGLTAPYNCLIRASWSNNNGGEFIMAVIDQNNPNWTTGIPNQSTQLQGTFTLPVTIRPYMPTTSMGAINWC